MGKNFKLRNIMFSTTKNIAETIWVDSEKIVLLSLLSKNIIPDKKDFTIERYEPYIITSVPLVNRQRIYGACDADDVEIKGVPKGQPVYTMLIHYDITPIAFIAVANGLPLICDGTSITIVWDNGLKRIFKP